MSRRLGTARLLLTALETRLTPSSAASAVAAPYAVGSRAGEAASASVYTADGTLNYSVTPFDGFTGGVRTALADVTGDGTADLIVAEGAGGTPTVAVYDGTGTHALVTSFDAFESTFTGGTYIASADLNNDGRAEVVVGAAEDGGPRVKVYDGASLTATGTPTALIDFLAIEDTGFRGGVRLSLGDIGGDGVPDLLVGAGRGGGPRVAAFDGAALAAGKEVKLFADFFAYEPGLRNGVFPTVGDLNGDGRGDLIFGAGPGGSPRVVSLDGKAACEGRQSTLSDFYAGDQASRSGVEVTTSTAADGTTSIVSTDLATNATQLFGSHGESHGRRGGHGTQGTTTIQGGGYTQADAATVSAAVVGSYAGTGTGLVFKLSDTAVDVTGTSGKVTASVTITSATAVVPTTSSTTTDTSTLPLRALTITGTVTLTTDSGTLTLPVSGTLLLSRSKSSSSTTTATAVTGSLRLSTDRSGADPTALGTGLALTASLSSDGLTVSRLLASDRTASPGYIVQSPESRSASRLVLAKAATTVKA